MSNIRYNLVFLISDLGCGGAQRVLINVLNNLDSTRYKISVITLYDEKSDFFILPDYVNRFVIGHTKSNKNIFQSCILNWRRVRDIKKKLIELNIDCAMSFIGAMNVLLIFSAKSLDIKIVISERNDPEKQKLGFPWDMLRKKYYREADIITANSHGAINTLEEYVPKDKLLYLPNPLPTTTKQIDRNDDKNNVIKILAVGRLYPQKNYPLLLHAISKCVRNQSCKYQLTIVGDGPLSEELEELACALGISDVITWKKNVIDIEKIYLENHIYVMTSSHEGMPNSLLEAMAYQLPVIVSNASYGPLEVIKDQVSGLIFKDNSLDELVEKIEYLASNSMKRAQLADKARSHIASYNNNEIIKIWENLFI